MGTLRKVGVQREVLLFWIGRPNRTSFGKPSKSWFLSRISSGTVKYVLKAGVQWERTIKDPIRNVWKIQQYTGFLQGSFLGGVLEKVGVEPQVQRIGKYKSAGDQLARKDMSPENREMLTALLDDLYTGFVEVTAAAKGAQSPLLLFSQYNELCLILRRRSDCFL